jgi:ABC-type nitrate/sulfonate/bicarbonate transport system permease component
MGNTLHNKIYLGRHSLFNSRRFQLALALGTCAGIALALTLGRSLR